MAGPIQQKASPSQASRTFARPTGNLSTAGMPTKQQIDAIVGAAETSKPQDRVELGASRDSGVDAVYSSPSRSLIPQHHDHGFRTKAIKNSGPWRSSTA